MSHLAAATLLNSTAEVESANPQAKTKLGNARKPDAALLFGKARLAPKLLEEKVEQGVITQPDIEPEASLLDSADFIPNEPELQRQDVEQDSEQDSPQDLAPQHLLEMRQVAGLSSGTCLALHEGTFEFSEHSDSVGFYISVHGASRVTAAPKASNVYVDEQKVDEPTTIGNSVLSVGSACFTVRRPRPNTSAINNLIAESYIGLVDDKPETIKVPESLISRSPQQQTMSDEEGVALDPESWEFLETVRSVRSAEAERLRRLHPDPEQIYQQLDRLERGVGNRSRDHKLFGELSLAYANLPWLPSFDKPASVPDNLFEHVKELSCLPQVPYTANLLDGPVGIVGSRLSTLAMARFALMSLGALSTPGSIELGIVTAKSNTQDWAWSAHLPERLAPSGESAYRVTVADGMSNFFRAGHEHSPEDNNEHGLIVLAETAAELPNHCSAVIEINLDGSCVISDKDNQVLVGTPIGVTEQFALSMSERLNELYESPSPNNWMTA